MALIDKLAAYWSLDEASGNAIDAHGSIDLTETSGTIASTTGKVGNCRDFELGDTEYFAVGDNATLSAGDRNFTMMGTARDGREYSYVAMPTWALGYVLTLLSALSVGAVAWAWNINATVTEMSADMRGLRELTAERFDYLKGRVERVEAGSKAK